MLLLRLVATITRLRNRWLRGLLVTRWGICTPAWCWWCERGLNSSLGLRSKRVYWSIRRRSRLRLKGVDRSERRGRLLDWCRLWRWSSSISRYHTLASLCYSRLGLSLCSRRLRCTLLCCFLDPVSCHVCRRILLREQIEVLLCNRQLPVG